MWDTTLFLDLSQKLIEDEYTWGTIKKFQKEKQAHFMLSVPKVTRELDEHGLITKVITLSLVDLIFRVKFLCGLGAGKPQAANLPKYLLKPSQRN